MSQLSVASSLLRRGEVLCCRWAVPIQWVEVSLAPRNCRKVHPREVPGRFPPSASTNPLPEPLVLWAAPSPLRTSTTCIVRLNRTRLDWTGFFRPHEHRARTRGQLAHPDSQPSSHTGQTGRGNSPWSPCDNAVLRSVCVSGLHVSCTTCQTSIRSLSAGRAEMMAR